MSQRNKTKAKKRVFNRRQKMKLLLLPLTAFLLFMFISSASALLITEPITIKTGNGSLIVSSGSNSYPLNNLNLQINTTYMTSFSWDHNLSAPDCIGFVNMTIINPDCVTKANMDTYMSQIGLSTSTLMSSQYTDLKYYMTNSLLPDVLDHQHLLENFMQMSAQKQALADRVTSLESDIDSCHTEKDSAIKDKDVAVILLGIVIVFMLYLVIAPNFPRGKIANFGSLGGNIG
jgi:hypothetical protein